MACGSGEKVSREDEAGFEDRLGQEQPHIKAKNIFWAEIQGAAEAQTWGGGILFICENNKLLQKVNS